MTHCISATSLSLFLLWAFRVFGWRNIASAHIVDTVCDKYAAKDLDALAWDSEDEDLPISVSKRGDTCYFVPRNIFERVNRVVVRRVGSKDEGSIAYSTLYKPDKDLAQEICCSYLAHVVMPKTKEETDYVLQHFYSWNTHSTTPLVSLWRKHMPNGCLSCNENETTLSGLLLGINYSREGTHGKYVWADKTSVADYYRPEDHGPHKGKRIIPRYLSKNEKGGTPVWIVWNSNKETSPFGIVCQQSSLDNKTVDTVCSKYTKKPECVQSGKASGDGGKFVRVVGLVILTTSLTVTKTSA